MRTLFSDFLRPYLFHFNWVWYLNWTWIWIWVCMCCTCQKLWLSCSYLFRHIIFFLSFSSCYCCQSYHFNFFGRLQIPVAVPVPMQKFQEIRIVILCNGFSPFHHLTIFFQSILLYAALFCPTSVFCNIASFDAVLETFYFWQILEELLHAV